MFHSVCFDFYMKHECYNTFCMFYYATLWPMGSICSSLYCHYVQHKAVYENLKIDDVSILRWVGGAISLRNIPEPMKTKIHLNMHAKNIKSDKHTNQSFVNATALHYSTHQHIRPSRNLHFFLSRLKTCFTYLKSRVLYKS